MTTEEKSSSGNLKLKQKKSISKLLLPNRPNKVGVEPIHNQLKTSSTIVRSSSVRSTVLERPLSLDLCSPSKEVNGHIRRCSSFSENDLVSKSPSALESDAKLTEKSLSHSSVLRPDNSKSSSSTDSLARKALLAAQVLHLIPTATARQRNYLQGRTGANSLLGATELEKTLPTREVTIFVGTWNMNGQNPPKELNDFVLPTGLEHVPDILAFGTQESCPEKFEWEVCLQETLGPSHVLFHSTSLDVTQNFDYVFWFGDLNFRLASPRNQVLEWLSNTSFPLPPHLPHGYMHHDQLCTILSDGAAFRGFTEANITFPPTYKYDPGTQNFDTSSKQRTPAYTDRILFKQRSIRRLSGQPETTRLECIVYDSVPSITTSDHKPVWGVFRAYVRPGIDTIPLAAGLFNREVYLEGIHRRATSSSESKAGSAVCSVQ